MTALDDISQVKAFWEDGACGEHLYLRDRTKEGYRRQAEIRYQLEPMIPEFARFESHRGKRVLEIGIGLGADHQRWAEAGVDLVGIDLTERAVARVRERLSLFDLRSDLHVGNAEALPFPDASFDVVYSWGVLMCSPNPQRAIDEVWRVLKPGGTALLMLYQRYSFVGYMLWARYALARMRPWMSLTDVYARYLESPGMKTYTVSEGRALMAAFERVQTKVYLTHGDLLSSDVGQRHRGIALQVARRIWPRTLISRFFPGHGLFMTLSGTKPVRRAAATSPA
jgi:SAM-dependent methyltransferase